jgi:hypothetical protein
LNEDKTTGTFIDRITFQEIPFINQSGLNIEIGDNIIYILVANSNQSSITTNVNNDINGHGQPESWGLIIGHGEPESWGIIDGHGQPESWGRN